MRISTTRNTRFERPAIGRGIVQRRHLRLPHRSPAALALIAHAVLVLLLGPDVAAAASPQAPFSAQVTGIQDGDTVTVLTADHHQIRIRLADIDAPEHDQPFGSRAKQALSGLVFGKQVELVPTDRDRYGRTVARVYADGIEANAEMVRSGFAWFYAKYSKRPEIRALEEAARAAHRGLWADTNPTAPWEFRAFRRTSPAHRPSVQGAAPSSP